MKFILFLFVCFLISCSSSTTLKEGRWTGNLTPMNHPDMNQPIGYDLSYQNNELKINLIGPDGTPVALQNPRVQNDTLYFPSMNLNSRSLLIVNSPGIVKTDLPAAVVMPRENGLSLP